MSYTDGRGACSISSKGSKKDLVQRSSIQPTAFIFVKEHHLANWLLYYPIEKTLAHFTDCLITINPEDYQLAKKRFKAEKIEHVHGVGVNTEQFKPVGEEQRNQLRQQYGYKENDFLLFYAAEFNKNKNQQLLIQALALIKDEVPNARLLLAGEGPLLEECRKLSIQLGIEEMVDFLGYRNDIRELVENIRSCSCIKFREGLASKYYGSNGLWFTGYSY